ncbi:hypothetical protein, partial [Escherichia coli]|uniref:hypothetical protein n=1 Tax=Escherichia coli TaxID=562 RepID=UPI0037DCBC4C
LNILTGCVHSWHEAAGAAELKVRCERGAEVSMYLLMRKITNETLDPHCCRSLVAFKISPNPDYHLITLTEMI